MTSYNREKYIGEAIESVLESTYNNFELIIVDDCSTDNTVKIAKSFAEKDARVKVFCNDKNLGDYRNRNKAASFATGKYLKYLDSDDKFFPWGLQVMVLCMEKFPEAGYGLMAYGLPAAHQLPLLFSPAQAYYAFYFQGAIIYSGPSGSIIRKDALERVGGFADEPYVSDIALWLSLSKHYSLAVMPRDLVWWRQHDEQQIKYEYQNKEIEAKRYQIFLDALLDNSCPFSFPYKSNAIRNLKNRYARNIIAYLSKGQIKRSLSLYNTIQLSSFDIVKSWRFNRYPPTL
jgi:glycosyltransferase involved in cell wall biosynthesis